MATIYGTDQSEIINKADGVTEGDDMIFGLEGNDDIIAFGGNDFLKGGGGADVFNGGAGIDTVDYTDSSEGVIVDLESEVGYGGTAEGDHTFVNVESLNGSQYDDLLVGTDLTENDVGNTLKGLEGNDILKGAGGADVLDGGEGIDTASYIDSEEGVGVNLETGLGVSGEAAGDTLIDIENLTGSNHGDDLIGDARINTLRGRGGADTLMGFAKADKLQGDAGNDTLKGGGGADVLNGGSGLDTADYSASTAGVTVELISGLTTDGEAEGDVLGGIENLTGSAHEDALWGDNGINVLAGLDGDDILKGFGGADDLRGGDDNDRLLGMAEADTLRGGDGTDTLDGGSNRDTMVGGFGSDTYRVDNSRDTVSENAGQGTDDRVLTSVSYTLGASADIENLISSNLAATTAIDLTGNDLRQGILGNNGDNVLAGLGGDDVIFAYDGNDTITGGLGTDDLEGRDGDDTISGGANVDYIFGGLGQDRLAGNAGADWFWYTAVGESAPGAAARDTIVDFAGGETIDVQDIDADTGTAGDQTFAFITGAFTAAGQIRAVQSGADTIVEFNTTGVGGAEMEIELKNFSVGDLGADDFLL